MEMSQKWECHKNINSLKWKYNINLNVTKMDMLLK